MKISFCKVLCLGVLLATGVANDPRGVRAQEAAKDRTDRRSVSPRTYPPTPSQQREVSSSDDRARQSTTTDAPLTNAPQAQLVLTLWELTLSDTAKQPEADSKSNLAWQLQNLPAEFGSLNEVRDFISRLKDAGRLQTWREVRLVTFDGQTARLQVGADRPQITGTNQTTMGRMNTIMFRSVGTTIEARPRIDTDHNIQVQLDYNASDLVKAEDVPLTENKDGTSNLASNIVNRQLKTTAKFKYGGAAIVQSDTTGGSADKSVKGQTVLIILGGSIAQPAEK